jgi:hypothetical protein
MRWKGCSRHRDKGKDWLSGSVTMDGLSAQEGLTDWGSDRQCRRLMREDTDM